ncbi:amino acid ABC transporter substrate-binding protein [Aminipila luticellarii]|mgnify:CR=1 FL=1|uniref:Amino acid ABC transporter substrate-binding protein n=1 Tax=Aminipila luticellarii TaxID=2507160 RepID=A0A410PY81_9FIRM|nr:amino acid ABC transporter substrate-binding protein [Aminipila luticellarii]QAT43898.1 amino acid ABC transporter substrate-binding protein [Aminipila luticellarii]
MKKLFTILLTIALVFGMLTGCGKTEQKEGSSSELTGWDYIKDKGELVIGLDDAFAPMGFRDEAGNLVGFDIDLANAVAEQLGVKATFKPIDWNAKDMELKSKRIDCVWNGMSVTDERMEKMALTDKYLNNKIIVMAKDDTIKVEKAADLAKYNVGTQADSSALEVLKANPDYDKFADKVSEYKTYDEALMDMKAGRIDCIAVDQVLGEYKNSKLSKKMVVCDYNFGDDYYAIGCRKEDKDVAAKITEGLDAVIKSGKAEEISNKWFGRNIVILEGYDK